MDENIELYEELSYGQDFQGEFVVYDDDPPVNVSNLTGYTARMEFRTKLDPNVPALFSLTTQNGGITINAGTGQIFWAITKVQSKLYVGKLYTELRLIDPQGKEAPAVWGTIKIEFRGTA